MKTNTLTTIDTIVETLQELALVRELDFTRTTPKNKRKGDFLTVRMEQASVVADNSDACDCIASIQFTKRGIFDFAFVFEPGRYRHCILEDLGDDIAIDESCRQVDTLDDVFKFFRREPYEWLGKKAWVKKQMKAAVRS